jgi:hypothetical protein
MHVRANIYLNIPSPKSGHTVSAALPCTATGHYVPETGTVFLDNVYCNGKYYDIKELSKDEIANIYDALYEAVLDLDF